MMRGWLALLAGAGLFALLAWGFGLDGVLAALRRASPAGLATYALISGTVVLLLATRWQLVARAVGNDRPLARFAPARLAGDAVAALLPFARVGGDPLRAVLAREPGAPLAPATAGVAVDRLLELLGNMLAVITYVSVFALSRHASSAAAPVALGAVMVVLLVLLVAQLVALGRGHRPLAVLDRLRRRVPRLGRWIAGLERVEAHLIAFFAARRRVFLAGCALALCTELLIVAQYHALLAAFGVRVELPVLLLVLLGGGLARAVPTPGALGALEGAQVLAVGAATGRAELGFVIGVLVRLHETVLLLAGLGALALLGGARLRSRLAPAGGAAS